MTEIFVLFLKRNWKYLVVIVVALGAVGFVYAKGFVAGANEWKVKYTKLEEKNKEEENDRLKVTNKAMADKLIKDQQTRDHNEEVINELRKQNAATIAERDDNLELAGRLLNDSIKRTTDSSVSKDNNYACVKRAGGTSSNEKLKGLLADVAAECERNSDRLDALIEEVSGQ